MQTQRNFERNKIYQVRAGMSVSLTSRPGEKYRSQLKTVTFILICLTLLWIVNNSKVSPIPNLKYGPQNLGHLPQYGYQPCVQTVPISG